MCHPVNELTVHRYWTGGPPPPHSDAFGYVSARTLGGRLVDWSDETLPREWVAYLDALSDQVHPEDVPRHRANILRWVLMRRYGGVWLDHDVVIYRSPPEVEWCAAKRRRPATCAMRLPAGAQLAHDMLAAIEAYDGPQTGCVDVSGDGLADRLWDVRIPLVELPLGQEGWAAHLLSTSRDRAARSALL